MLRSLLTKYVYVKVYENRFIVKLVEDGARPITVTPTEPFTTARLLIGGFGAAERVLSQAFKELFASQWFSPSPVVVIHPMEKVEGGLSEIEDRAFRELAVGAGARKVVVWVGHELSDAEMRECANSGSER